MWTLFRIRRASHVYGLGSRNDGFCLESKCGALVFLGDLGVGLLWALALPEGPRPEIMSTGSSHVNHPLYRNPESSLYCYLDP